MTCYSAANFGDWRSDSHARQGAYMERVVLPMVQRSALFGGVDRDGLAWLFSRCYLKVLRSGERVYSAGDLPDAIYLLVSGSVRLTIESNRSVLVKEDLCAGATFGDTAFLGIQPHSDTATCTDNAEILAISSQALADLQTQNPALFTLLLLNLSREISRRLIGQDLLYCELNNHLAP